MIRGLNGAIVTAESVLKFASPRHSRHEFQRNPLPSLSRWTPVSNISTHTTFFQSSLFLYIFAQECGYLEVQSQRGLLLNINLISSGCFRQSTLGRTRYREKQRVLRRRRTPGNRAPRPCYCLVSSSDIQSRAHRSSPVGRRRWGRVQ